MESHELNPDRVVFCRFLMEQWLQAWRETIQVEPDSLLAMALVMEEVSMELRREAKNDSTTDQAPDSAR